MQQSGNVASDGALNAKARFEWRTGTHTHGTRVRDTYAGDRDTSVTQAIEAVGKNPVARMHDLLECPQREWPKDFLRSSEACEQTLEKGPAAQMRQALPQS